MNAIKKFLEHKSWCGFAQNSIYPCNCGYKEAAAELARLQWIEAEVQGIVSEHKTMSVDDIIEELAAALKGETK